DRYLMRPLMAGPVGMIERRSKPEVISFGHDSGAFKMEISARILRQEQEAVLRCGIARSKHYSNPRIRDPLAEKVRHRAYEVVAWLLPMMRGIELVAVKGWRKIKRIWLDFFAIESNAPHLFIKHRIICEYRHLI